jgi:hypothetical protein
MLFDISPDEPQPKKKAGKSRARVKAAPPPAEVAAPVLAPYFIGERPIPALGTIDGEYVCADDSCAAGSHDILAEFDGEWTVECALCGTRQRVAAIRDHLKPKGDVFVVSDGRFAGMTLDEISRQPRGPEWLAWAVAEHPRQFVREAVQKHALTVAR